MALRTRGLLLICSLSMACSDNAIPLQPPLAGGGADRPVTMELDAPTVDGGDAARSEGGLRDGPPDAPAAVRIDIQAPTLDAVIRPPTVMVTVSATASQGSVTRVVAELLTTDPAAGAAGAGGAAAPSVSAGPPFELPAVSGQPGTYQGLMPIAPTARSGIAAIRITAESQGTVAPQTAASRLVKLDNGPRITIISPMRDQPFGASANVVAIVEPAFMGEGVSGVAASIKTVSTAMMPTTGNRFELPMLDLTTGFSPPLRGPTELRVSAKSAGSMQVGEAKVTFNVDRDGPTLRAISPTSGELKGGTTVLVVEAVDPSGILRGSVTATLPGLGNRVVTLEEAGGNTFTGRFDTRDFGIPGPGDVIYPALPSVVFSARDNAGNGTSLGLTFRLDNTPPVLDLDPASLRVLRRAGDIQQCSHLMDPVGEDAVSDLSTALQLFSARLIALDRGNTPRGLTHAAVAGIDPASVELFIAQADSTTQLVVDTAPSDGVCDQINPTLDPSNALAPPMGVKAISLRLEEIAVTGAADFTPDPTATCPAGGEAARPPALCAYTTQTQVLALDVTNGTSGLYSLPPAGSNCPGEQFDSLAAGLQDGWHCLAARATDKVGNRSVSAPIRVCISRDGAHVSDCAARFGTPPACRGFSSGTALCKALHLPRDFDFTTSPYTFFPDQCLDDGSPNGCTTGPVRHAVGVVAPAAGTAVVTGSAVRASAVLDGKPITAITAQVGAGPAVSLLPDATGTYTGALSVAGLPTAPSTLVVTATNSEGFRLFSKQQVDVNAGATVAIVTPTANQIVGNTVDIEADVQLPITAIGVASVTAQIAGQVNVGLTRVGTTSRYRATAVNLTTGFTTVPAGATDIVVTAATAAPIVATTARVTLQIDRTGPAITNPTPPSSQVVGGLVRITATVTDPAGVNPSSVNVTLQDLAANQVRQMQSLAGNVFYVDVDTTAFSAAITQPRLLFAATDGVGNQSTLTASITLDRAGPSITSISPAAGGLLIGTAARISAQITDANSINPASVTLTVPTLSATPIVMTQDSNTFFAAIDTTLIPLNVTAPTFSITAKDTFGNSSTATGDFTLDRTAPTIAMVFPTPGQVVASSGALTISATITDTSGVDAATAMIALRDLPSPGPFLMTRQGATGFTYTVANASTFPASITTAAAVITVKDLAGNSASLSTSFVLDRVGPTITSVSPSNGQLVAGLTRFSATISDGVAVDATSVGATLGSQSIPLLAEGGGVFATNFDTRTLAVAGVYPVQPTMVVSARDSSGNFTSVSVQFKIDNTVPILELDPPSFRELRAVGASTECSRAFDPLGTDALGDLQLVTSTFKPRLLAYDAGGPGTGLLVPPIARIDPASVTLFVAPAQANALLVDGTPAGDGICDAIDSAQDPSTPAVAGVLKARAFALSEVALGGAADFRPENNVSCTTGTGATPPGALCSGSTLTRVLPASGLTAGATGLFVSNPSTCLGDPIDLVSAQLTAPGWYCAAARARDTVGNTTVSAPMRFCVGALANGQCNGVNPPDCRGCAVRRISAAEQLITVPLTGPPTTCTTPIPFVAGGPSTCLGGKDFRVDITAPLASAVLVNNAAITVAVTTGSTAPFGGAPPPSTPNDTVVATVGSGPSVNLGCVGGCGTSSPTYQGNLNLTGVSSGNQTLLVIATRGTGEKAVASRVIVANTGPILTLVSPALNAPVGQFLTILTDIQTPGATVTSATVQIQGGSAVALQNVPGTTTYCLGVAPACPFNNPIDLSVGFVPPFQSFTSPAPATLTINATSSAAPPNTAALSSTFLVDLRGPTIAINAPGTQQIVGGTISVSATITDPSSVNAFSVLARFPDATGINTAALTALGNNVFSGSFDTRAFGRVADNGQLRFPEYPTIEVEASDAVGNVTRIGQLFALDSFAPIMDLDPPTYRELRDDTDGSTGTCSTQFDPLGGDAVADQRAALQVFDVRYMAYDRGNGAPGSDLEKTSGILASSPELVVLRTAFTEPNTNNGLVEDSDCDGVCDRIVPAYDPKRPDVAAPVGATKAFAYPMVEMSAAGAANFSVTEPGVACSPLQSTTPPQPVGAPGPADELSAAPPILACSDTPRLIPLFSASSTGVYSLPAPSLCTQLDTLAAGLTDGWLCMVGRMTDNVGNAGVSAPTRVCLDQQGTRVPGAGGHAACNATFITAFGAAPSCRRAITCNSANPAAVIGQPCRVRQMSKTAVSSYPATNTRHLPTTPGTCLDNPGAGVNTCP